MNPLLKCTYSTTTVHWTGGIYTGHLQRNVDSRDSDALTVTQIMPSMHHCLNGGLLNMETPVE